MWSIAGCSLPWDTGIPSIPVGGCRYPSLGPAHLLCPLTVSGVPSRSPHAIFGSVLHWYFSLHEGRRQNPLSVHSCIPAPSPMPGPYRASPPLDEGMNRSFTFPWLNNHSSHSNNKRCLGLWKLASAEELPGWWI